MVSVCLSYQISYISIWIYRELLGAFDFKYSNTLCIFILKMLMNAIHPSAVAKQSAPIYLDHSSVSAKMATSEMV